MNKAQRQHGGTLLGFILGLVVGLGVALGVAMYVTKVPTPFSNKNQARSSDQDAVESRKNKDWNPNGVLQPKAPASVPVDPASAPASGPAAAPASAAALPGLVEAPRKEVKPAVSADPLGDLAKSKTAAAPGDAQAEPFQYFVQVGAYRSQAEADAQKARMALMGLDARVSEREQAGRTVYRVRLGPFDDKAVAERLHARLDGAQIDNTIVRIQR